VGFEPTIPVSERPQTHALDRAATGIGGRKYTWRNLSHYSGMCLEGLRKSTNILSQDCRYPVRELEQESLGYEIGFAMFGEGSKEVSVQKQVKG
jgi:hypothetical protein